MSGAKALKNKGEKKKKEQRGGKRTTAVQSIKEYDPGLEL